VLDCSLAKSGLKIRAIRWIGWKWHEYSGWNDWKEGFEQADRATLNQNFSTFFAKGDDILFCLNNLVVTFVNQFITFYRTKKLNWLKFKFSFKKRSVIGWKNSSSFYLYIFLGFFFVSVKNVCSKRRGSWYQSFVSNLISRSEAILFGIGFVEISHITFGYTKTWKEGLSLAGNEKIKR